MSIAAIQSGISQSKPSGPRSPLWGDDAQCTLDHAHSSSTGYKALDVFTADGSYLPRTHCLTTQTGETDWPVVWLLVLLNAIIIIGYVRIFIFWRKAYLQEELQDRNKKLMDLAWIFLFCAICGYVSSIVLFFWPAYRLLALMLIPLGFFTWKFASNLDEFKVSLSAKRLSRQLNESLFRENAELEAKVLEATKRLQIAKDRAESADRAKSEFLAHMSHEIRTPLTAIIGYTDIVLEESGQHPDQQADRRDNVQTIKQNSSHLLHLINDILDMTQIESGTVNYEMLSCSIRDIVDEVVEMMAIKAKLKGSIIHINIHESIPDRVSTDPTRVKQMITNLIGNAVKFTELGDVFVEVMPANASQSKAGSEGQFMFAITIRDTGIGIVPDRLKAIFEPFTQESSSTRRTYGGSGLGLAISRRIAQDLGGDLTAESELGIGSSFTCTLATQIVSAESTSCPNALELIPEFGNTFKSSRILLVEDGSDNRRLILHHFKKAGIHVETAVDGLIGIAKVNQAIENGTPYDIILMDISMPNMDGIECTKELRKQGLSTPIIMLSAHVLKEERDRCFSIGASAYHCKPIDFPALFQTCAQFVNEPIKRAA